MNKVKINDLLLRVKDAIFLEDEKIYKRVTIKTKGQGVFLRDVKKGSNIGTKRQFLVSKGQFLLSKIDARNGAFGIAGEDVDGAIITGNFWAYEVNKEILNIEWFNLFVSSDHFVNICDKSSSGTTNRKYLDENKFLAYEFHLPSLDEQNKFIKKYLNLKNYLDKVQTEIQAQQENIQKLRKQILKDAFKGNLVKQDGTDEVAVLLLSKIQDEKAKLIKKGKRNKNTLDNNLKIDNPPYNLPESWEWVRLSDVGELSRGKSKHRPRNDEALFKNGAYPFIQTGDVARSNGIVNGYSGMYNELGLQQSKLWSKGTLCITIAANIADTGILNFDACFPDSIVGYVPYKPIPTAKYFHYFIVHIKENLISFAPATAQKNINLEILNNLRVPLPPLNEMKKIVKKTENLMLVCDNIECTLNETKGNVRKLLDKLIEEVTNID